MLVTKMAKTVTNILKLSPTHFVSNIRHQHRCSHNFTIHLPVNFCSCIIEIDKIVFTWWGSKWLKLGLELVADDLRCFTWLVSRWEQPIQSHSSWKLYEVSMVMVFGSSLSGLIMQSSVLCSHSIRIRPLSKLNVIP